MKIPLTPPSFDEVVKNLGHKGRWFPDKFSELLRRPVEPAGQYLHWDKLRHLTPPADLSSEEWWLVIKIARQALYRKLPFTDRYGRHFNYAMPDLAVRLCHQVDRDTSGRIQAAEQITNPQMRDTYLVSSLIEEAITSSQLEGASTTRKVAKEMLREGRKPRDRSEQMIFNNYRAMQFIREITRDEITPSIVLELHRLLTEDTLDDPKSAGKLRTKDDIHVMDVRDGVILHTPPAATELKARMDKLCRFADESDSEPFLHPVIRAILLHFMLGYDHPFVDGNGRVARALFYWSMLKQGYWLTEYISISRILKSAPAEYARAFLHTETDENDTTYFIVHQLEVILRAVQDLQKYLARKASEVHEIEVLIRRSPKLQQLLNHRQITLLSHAMRHPNATYRIEGHRQSHNVTYDTARTDLLELAELGLLEKTKAGKAFVFISPPNLTARLKKIGSK